MRPWRRRPVSVREITDVEIGTVTGGTVFTLGPGNHARSSLCLLCRMPVGRGPVTVAGGVAVGPRSCLCGSIPSNMFLICACHLPADPDDITRAMLALSRDSHDHVAVVTR